jgi:hypothetical protein
LQVFLDVGKGQGLDATNTVNQPWPRQFGEERSSVAPQNKWNQSDEITSLPGPTSRAPVRRYFSKVITDTTSELPVTVIKELKSGFKNYIPLSLCTHKACTNATQSTDAFDTEIGMNDKGEIRLKQKTLTAAKDHYITTNDLMEIRENLLRGMGKYLILGDDTEPGAPWAIECIDMFREFFSAVAARPDYTQDWPSYRGYMVELL